MKIEIVCPCCNKKIQIILSDVDTSLVTGVLLNEDDSKIKLQEELEKELFDKQNILLG